MPPDPVLTIIDAESGGDISRVIIGGAPVLRGATVAEQCADFAARYDHLRWKLMQPPHGELHMCPVLLLADPAGEADFGVIIMESMGYPPISGSNLFCATAVALETGFTPLRQPETRLRVATPGGMVALAAQCQGDRCSSVAFENQPAHIRNRIEVPDGGSGMPVGVTVVAAGVDYAAVRSADLGLTLAPGALERLVRHGKHIAYLAGTDFVLFHEVLDTSADGVSCRLAVFQKPSVICRSPTGTGTSAMLTLAFDAGLISPGMVLTTRSPFGGEFHGHILSTEPNGPGRTLRTVVTGAVRTGRPVTIP